MGKTFKDQRNWEERQQQGRREPRQEQIMKRWVFTLVTVDLTILPDEGPGAISFRSTIINAVDESDAYMVGMRFADAAGWYDTPSADYVRNDYVVEV